MIDDDASRSWCVCLCNTCSGQLEFDASRAGGTAQCPHCGVDTVLFVPNVRVPRSSRALRVGAVQAAAINESVGRSSGHSRGIIVTTGNDVAGRAIEQYLGLVRGIVVRTPNVVQSMFGEFKQITGGNIESFTRVCEEARTQAYYRMVEHARSLGADAIIAVRYDATEFTPEVTEVLAYGTAVKLTLQSPPGS